MLAQNTKTTQQSDVIRTSSTCKRKKEDKTAEEMQNTSKKSDENDGNRKHEKCSILKIYIIYCLTSSQIWLIPLVDDEHSCTNLTKCTSKCARTLSVNITN